MKKHTINPGPKAIDRGSQLETPHATRRRPLFAGLPSARPNR